MPVTVKTSSVGLRERNKIDKLRRIKAAARELFVSRGFDDTTTRDVARAADVGLGTVFAYAENKRDLLFLIVNDDLDDMISQSAKLVEVKATTIDSFMAVFRKHYEFFSRQPEITRLVMRELQFYDVGEQAERTRATTDRVVTIIAELVSQGQRRGELRSDEDPAFVGAIAFSILRWQLRQWLSTAKPDLKKGMSELRRAMQLFLLGMAIRR